MKVKQEFVSANAIVLARNFNPSLIRQEFLVKVGVASPEALSGGGAIYTDVMAQVPVTGFHLVCTPDRVQFVPAEVETGLEPLVKLVEALPHTPYHAAGLNFTWRTPNDDSLSRHLFWRDTALYDAFAADDARFGAYLSRELDGGIRLRLDIKPVRTVGEEWLQFGFNFHLELGSEPVPELVSFLRRWSEFYASAEKLATGEL